MQAANLLRLLQSAPTAAKLYSALQRAQQGDRQAIEYLRSEGWAEAIDLVAPGAGPIAREALERGLDAVRVLRGVRPDGNVIEAEYTVVEETPPWAGFLRRLFAMRFGGHIVMGPCGSGKTTLALRLAQRYADQHGYVVEGVNMYDEDAPEWVTPISSSTLVKRMKRVRQYLETLGVPDDDEEDGDGAAQPPADEEPPSLPPRGRVIIVDEASIGMTVGDPARKAAIQALTQCRHLDWVVILLAQWAGQLPLPLLGQTVKWVKKPAGDEEVTDRDNPVVRLLWRLATEAFRDLRRSQWYREPYTDVRSWAFCDSKSLDGKAGYQGLIPFGMPDRG